MENFFIAKMYLTIQWSCLVPMFGNLLHCLFYGFNFVVSVKNNFQELKFYSVVFYLKHIIRGKLC